jgi:hypothetical protein
VKRRIPSGSITNLLGQFIQSPNDLHDKSNAILLMLHQFISVAAKGGKGKVNKERYQLECVEVNNNE